MACVSERHSIGAFLTFPAQWIVQIEDEIKKLVLDDKKVSQRERERFVAEPVNAPFPIKAAYHTLCFLLDVVYEGRPIQRFWVRIICAT